MPGLVIHRSERADRLVDALADVLAEPAGDPFVPEVVAVPSRGVERWLAQRLSHVLGAGPEGDGVCANVRFPNSSEVLDRAAAAAHGPYADAVESWSPLRAVWPLMAIVDEVRHETWAAPLAAHLSAGEGRRFAVASTLARHVERYGRSRPAMLRGWRDGEPADLPPDLLWQARLWRLLREQLGPSPAELLDAACARLRDDSAAVELPGRVSVFGLTRLSPSRVGVLTALAARRDVHLWLHHPSPALWRAVAATGAVPGPRRDDPTGPAVRHPLLRSLSRDVRELQVLVAGAAGGDLHHPMPPPPATLLGRLQRGLADDDVPTTRVPIAADDRSLTVHACHGPARQVEVVREIVLGLLRDDPTLEPRDIVIMCPDVEVFAPLVAASFGMTDEPGGHPAAQLRVRLADRDLQQTNPMLALLAQLLELGAHRVTASQLLDLAGSAPVRARFGFGDDEIEELRDRTAAANARWGLDARHRAPYGLENLEQGTWRRAVDRMLVGVALEEDDRWLGDVLPLDDVDSGAIDLVGRFAEFVDRVDAVLREAEHPHPVGEWASLLAEAVLGLGEPERAWQGAQLTRELDELAEAAGDTDVSLSRAEVTALIEHRLSGRPTRASFRTGTLTVCTLVPMRSVPHRVVCLLGMDDGAFPRQGVVDGDDVLARDPVIGERDVRSEDRQLFLDAICAAEQHLVIAYTGADPRTGVEVPPCVPLGELLDAVDAAAAAPDGGAARDHVVVRHPLQPFDARNFTPGALGAPVPFSFDTAALAGARAALDDRRPVPALVTAPLPAVPADDTVELDDLEGFLVAPVKTFLQQRLLVSTWQDDDEPADELPLAMDGLPSWAVGDRLLRNRLRGMSVEACREVELRRGDLPPGRIGERLLQTVGGSVEALLLRCETVRATPPHSVEIAVPLDDGRTLTGTVGGVHGTTLLDVSYSSLGPKQRLRAWVRYLALVAQSGDATIESRCVGRGGGGARQCVFRGLDRPEAVGVLTDLAGLRDAGLRTPLPFAPKTSWAYADRMLANKGDDAALRSAETQWRGRDYPGENAEAAHALVLGASAGFEAFTAVPAPDGLDFAALAMRVWQRLASAESS
ncbi:exodeoxyribonuclease V subunit gamma [Jatrophihabitans fulvus]